MQNNFGKMQEKVKPDEAHVWTDEQLKELESRIADEYKKAAAELQTKIDDYFAQFKGRDAEQLKLLQAGKITKQEYTQWRLAQIGRGKRFEALRDRLAERMTKANEVTAAYINDSTPGIYSLNRNYAAYTIEQQVGSDVGFDLWDEQTVKRLIVEKPDIMPYYPPERAVKRGFDLAYGKRQITAQVTSGILQGESIKHLADRLQANIPTMNRTSAIRAARTAATGAQNAGRMDSYAAAEEMGIELEREWLATLDNRTRHTHRILDRQRAKMSEPFKADGYEIWYPGDSSAPGHLVYNCRCTLLADVKDTPKPPNPLRRAIDPETGESVMISDMSYAQWESWKKSENRCMWETYQKKGQNCSSDQKQFAEYQAVLDKNAPRTFAEFQDLKYNNNERWNFAKLDYARRRKLISHPEMALSGAETAKAPSGKFTGYLFNPDNPKGWTKGQAFTSRLGYSADNWEQLQSEILRGSKLYPATPKLKDDYGQRYEQLMILYGKTGNPANVVVGWIQKPDGSVSMTTVYIKEV